MNLRELLKKDFKIDLPISGGNGNSIDNPVVVHYQHPNDYVGVEYAVFNGLYTGRRFGLLGKGSSFEWKFIKQTLIHHNGRKIDQMKFETKETSATEIITQVENYYFDITECFGRLDHEI
jgi:hypothetical protein